MSKVELNLDFIVDFGDDLTLDLYMFEGGSDTAAHKASFDIENLAEEFVAVRQNFQTGILDSQFIGDADCLAARLRVAASILERAVEKAYEADK